VVEGRVDVEASAAVKVLGPAAARLVVDDDRVAQRAKGRGAEVEGIVEVLPHGQTRGNG
jgi:hypothetical protein